MRSCVIVASCRGAASMVLPGAAGGTTPVCAKLKGMAATRRPSRPARKSSSSSSRAPAKRKPTRAKPRTPREPLLGPGQARDLAGLALIVLGAYAAFVLYGRSDGAAAGTWLSDTLHRVVGRGAGVAPLVAIAAGAALLVRIDPARLRPFRLGGLLALTGLLLAVSETSVADDGRLRQEGGSSATASPRCWPT